MKFFGFENDDDYDDTEDYPQETRSDKRNSNAGRRSNSRSGSGSSNVASKIIIYNGIATEEDKRRLCEEFNNGAIIMIDLHMLNQREFEEEGKDFITFMGGVAFGRKGNIQFIDPAQYLLVPRDSVYEIWPEEREHE